MELMDKYGREQCWKLSAGLEAESLYYFACWRGNRERKLIGRGLVAWKSDHLLEMLCSFHIDRIYAIF